LIAAKRSRPDFIGLCIFTVLAFTILSPTQSIAQTARNAGGRPVHNEAERASHWKLTAIPYHSAARSPQEQQMVAKLADACRLMDQLYWQQSDLGGYAVYHVTKSPVLAELFGIMGNRYDLLTDNETFLGEATILPGRELYPYRLTSQQIEQYVAAHPESKADIYSPRTVVHGTPDQLTAVPYHVAYAQWLQPMAADLRAAAKLSPDPAFAHYLRLRADALLSDDYSASNIAWLDLKNPKIDLIFAPEQTNIDGLLGVKTSYGGAILIRNNAESAKLDLYQKHEADMQQALPVPDADKPSRAGLSTPMVVADSPLRAGNLHYGYQTVAQNLPNDPKIRAEKGSKKIIFKNFMDARLNFIILPVAAKMLNPTQAKDVSADGYFVAEVLHEISHGLGPAYAQVNGQQTNIREAIGPIYGDLEEAKADVTGIYLAKWLVDQKLLPQSELNSIYASYVAGIFRTLRFGNSEAHGRAAMMEFNYLVEHGALSQGADGLYAIDYAAIPDAITSLDTQLLTVEANGDRAGAEAWFTKYDVAPASLTKALLATKDIPVDIAPEFELSHGVRP
jgi:hypothetical protein